MQNIFSLVEPVMVASYKVSFPDMEVNFKPAAYVSVKSTKRYIWETTAKKLSKTSHVHVTMLFKISLKKSKNI